MKETDFLVVGGGIIGLSTARELRRQFREKKVMVLEKEAECGLHASGRNSGVIHAGFYYSADSLKAKFTREGNVALTNYCIRKNIPLNRCGKLVVARGPSELPQLDELLRRGKANGVPLEDLSESEAKAIEPRSRTFERAIFSPSTSTADPVLVIRAIKEDALAEGISVCQNVRYLGRSRGGIISTAGEFRARYVINTAGLYADRVAHDFGFARDYRILPFKGIYLYSDEPAGALKTHIYPVPDLQNPFLGVHFTVMADGQIKIGPTAIPALWREQYSGFSNFKPAECLEILMREMGLLLTSDFAFHRLALRESTKYFRSRLVSLASTLLEGVEITQFCRWGKPGIRAQLLNIRTRKLEMDFVLEGNEHSLHVLNAVSPAWTCAFPFAKYVVDKIKDLLK